MALNMVSEGKMSAIKGIDTHLESGLGLDLFDHSIRKGLVKLIEHVRGEGSNICL